MRCRAPRHLEGGLTLLELLVVVVLMSMVGLVAMSEVSDHLGQARYEDTANRWALIRRAIIGDTDRTLNGQPEIRGFVADMGRLPRNLNELLVQDYCSDPAILIAADCTTAGGTWTSQPASGVHGDSGLRAGWNGPYVGGFDSDPGYRVFRDGWGNDDGSNDFGWVLAFDDVDANGIPDSSLTLTSLGADAATGDAGASDFDGDHPPAGKNLVDPSDHLIAVTDGSGNGGLTLDLGHPRPYCTQPAYETAATCTGAGGSWVPTPNCSDPAQATEVDCTTAGATWILSEPSCVGSSGTPVPDPPVTRATCEAEGRTWVWPSQTLCARLFAPVDGVVPDLASAIVSTNQATVLLDGSQRLASYRFPNATVLTQGVRALGLYWYDTAASACTLAPFPGGQDPRHYAFLARSPLQPLPWPLD